MKYAAALRDSQEVDSSVEHLQRAAQMFEKCTGPGHRYVASAKIELALSLSLTGNQTLAHHEATDALRIFREACGADHSDTKHAGRLVAQLEQS